MRRVAVSYSSFANDVRLERELPDGRYWLSVPGREPSHLCRVSEYQCAPIEVVTPLPLASIVTSAFFAGVIPFQVW
jgi:hypothetical protein